MDDKMVQLTKMMEVGNHGHILYIYDSMDAYMDNAVSYILAGIEQGHHIMLIEDHDVYKQIHQRLKKSLRRDELKCVHSFDNDEFYRVYHGFDCELIVDHFSKLMSGFNKNNITIRTWANVAWDDHEENITSKLEHFEHKADVSVHSSSLISVCAYNGEKISATFHNKLQRSHEYMMTDSEFVKSELYYKKNDVFPSFSIQRNQTMLEGELMATKDHLKSFIMQNLDPVLILDNSDKILTVNNAFVETFGYSVDEILGSSVEELPIIPNEYKFEVKKNSVLAQTGNIVDWYETERYTKDGRLIQVILSSFPLIDKESNVNGRAVIIRDITERKQARELLIKSEKLSIVGELAAGIAHEIRNPITSIQGFLQLMQSSNTANQRYFDIIFSEINRIELILSELLMLAKPQAVHYAPKNVRVLMKDVITLLEPQAILKNVQIKTDFPNDTIMIVCEENQLKQVFINFIKNAIEAMNQGGEITLRMKKLNGKLLIQFIDQGCGIPIELISKLGQPFYTTKEKGTGLGFMVSKKIIENHQGTITIKSELNKGTTIDVLLPL